MNRQKEGAGLHGLTTTIKVILTSLYATERPSRRSREETWNILFMQFCREPLEEPIQVSTELAREIQRAELPPEGDYLYLTEP